MTRKYSKSPRKFRRKCTLEQFLQRVKESPQALQDVADEVIPFFENGLQSLVPEVRNMFVEELSKVGILSFSSEVTNPLLWAHYADNGKGFVYEFDASHIFFHSYRFPSDEFFHLRRVRYSNEQATGHSLTDLDGDYILCTKAESWGYEAEWRILAPLEQAKRKVFTNGEDIHLFEIPATALVRVILGANTDSSLEDKIKSILKNRGDLSHVELARIRPNFTSRSMDVIAVVDSN